MQKIHNTYRTNTNKYKTNTKQIHNKYINTQICRCPQASTVSWETNKQQCPSQSTFAVAQIQNKYKTNTKQIQNKYKTNTKLIQNKYKTTQKTNTNCQNVGRVESFSGIDGVTG